MHARLRPKWRHRESYSSLRCIPFETDTHSASTLLLLGGTRILFDGLREMRDHRLFDGLLSRAGDSRVGTLPSHMGWNLSRVAQRHSPIVIRGVHNLLLLHLKRDLGLSLVDPDLHLAGPIKR